MAISKERLPSNIDIENLVQPFNQEQQAAFRSSTAVRLQLALARIYYYEKRRLESEDGWFFEFIPPFENAQRFIFDERSIHAFKRCAFSMYEDLVKAGGPIMASTIIHLYPPSR